MELGRRTRHCSVCCSRMQVSYSVCVKLGSVALGLLVHRPPPTQHALAFSPGLGAPLRVALVCARIRRRLYGGTQRVSYATILMGAAG